MLINTTPKSKKVARKMFPFNKESMRLGIRLLKAAEFIKIAAPPYILSYNGGRFID